VLSSSIDQELAWFIEQVDVRQIDNASPIDHPSESIASAKREHRAGIREDC